ncbi:MAG: hypothetical protein J3Q66DRAFT_390137 [Benniella sp.]|nr:MAG: hypothetical protein J3Q66DRAFT_390137 [Benniella sp.]
MAPDGQRMKDRSERRAKKDRQTEVTESIGRTAHRGAKVRLYALSVEFLMPGTVSHMVRATFITLPTKPLSAWLSRRNKECSSTSTQSSLDAIARIAPTCYSTCCLTNVLCSSIPLAYLVYLVYIPRFWAVCYSSTLFSFSSLSIST